MVVVDGGRGRLWCMVSVDGDGGGKWWRWMVAVNGGVEQ